ncbi:unnamed protein product, partial [Allacma fusca]
LHPGSDADVTNVGVSVTNQEVLEDNASDMNEIFSPPPGNDDDDDVINNLY